MKRLFLILLGALLLIIGCGGGSGGDVGQPGTATVDTFATDSLETDYDQVWVTIYKVSLDGDSGSQDLLDDSAGRLIDLKSLRDGAGPKYSFLERANVRTGGYTTIRVELDERLSLVPTGSNVAENRLFATRHAKVGFPGRSELRLPAVVSATGRVVLIVDFDLKNWDLDATGRVVAVLRRGNGEGLDDSRRHVRGEFKGTVTGLSGTAPNQTFRLNRGPWSLQVKTDSNTSIFNESGAANPMLANGQRVEATGAFLGGVLVASSIKIEDEPGDDPHHIKGVASNLNEPAGTFTITVRRAKGFIPDRREYTVVTNADTRFMSDAGAMLTKSDFFALLAAAGSGAQVHAEGTALGATFTARKVKLDIEEGNDAEIKGTITQLDPIAGTLTMSATRWEGVSLQNGASVRVVTRASTHYRLGNSMVSKSAFFAAIAIGGTVEAKGNYANGTLTAIRLKKDD